MGLLPTRAARLVTVSMTSTWLRLECSFIFVAPYALHDVGPTIRCWRDMFFAHAAVLTVAAPGSCGSKGSPSKAALKWIAGDKCASSQALHLSHTISVRSWPRDVVVRADAVNTHGGTGPNLSL